LYFKSTRTWKIIDTRQEFAIARLLNKTKLATNITSLLFKKRKEKKQIAVKVSKEAVI
jgi:hypothetical protein